MRSLLLVALALVLSTGTRAQETRPDDEVRAAWERLGAEDRAEIVAWFQAEIDRLDTLQLGLVRHARELLGQRPSELPAAEEAPFFEPAVHAPKGSASRERLAFDDARARRERERRFEDVPERALRPAYRYHWGLGRIERDGDPGDPERVFHNALYGLPPGLDLAEAVVASILDDGEERAVHRAFSHLYADRSGRVYPGITLYDAWCSGQTMEMPDVDTLGIVHTVLDEWSKWKAPVPSGSKQRALYDQVGELFTTAHRHRGLRVALARTWAAGSPVLRDGYAPSLAAFHLVWEEAGSDPQVLFEDLPSDRQWARWVEKAQKRAEKRSGEELVLLRRGTLDGNAWTVRYTLEWVLDGYGAFAE